MSVYTSKANIKALKSVNHPHFILVYTSLMPVSITDFTKKSIVNSFVDISPTVEFKLLYRTVSPNLCADLEKYFN